MANIQLDDYIARSRSEGVSDDNIKSKLLESGWSQDIVGKAFNLSDHPQSNLKSTKRALLICLWVIGAFLLLIVLLDITIVVGFSVSGL